jgi:hypothetical protein
MAFDVLSLSNMKRSNKLAVKTETVRALSNQQLTQVGGGAGTGYCQAAGDAKTSGSITSEYGGIQVDYNQLGGVYYYR